MLKMKITSFRPKDPGRSQKTYEDGLWRVFSFSNYQWLSSIAMCDWHDFCSDAECPTEMDWQAI